MRPRRGRGGGAAPRSAPDLSPGGDSAPMRCHAEAGTLAAPRPALTLQPLLLEPCSDVAHVRSLQGLAGHVQRGLRPVEMGQLIREVHGVRALQPPPWDAAAVQRRVPQLVAEALQLLLAQVLQRRQQQLAGGGGAGLHAEGRRAGEWGQHVCRVGDPGPASPSLGAGDVGAPATGRGSDAPQSRVQDEASTRAGGLPFPPSPASREQSWPQQGAPPSPGPGCVSGPHLGALHRGRV